MEKIESMKARTYIAGDYACVKLGDTTYYYGYEYAQDTDPERYETEEDWDPWGFYVEIGNQIVYKVEDETQNFEPHEAILSYMAEFFESIRHRIGPEEQD
jgi:hypothetical protein